MLVFVPYGSNMTKKYPTPFEQPTPRKPFLAEPHHIWLTPRGMVERFGMSIPFWYRRRRDDDGPPFVPIGGRSLLYRMDLVEAWFDQHLVTGFGDPKYKEIALRRAAKKTKSQFDPKLHEAQVRETTRPLDWVTNLPAPQTLRQDRVRILSATEAFRVQSIAPAKFGLALALRVAGLRLLAS